MTRKQKYEAGWRLNGKTYFVLWLQLKNQITAVRFQVLTVMSMKTNLIWDVAQSSLVEID
jgi:hypothetical protein